MKKKGVEFNREYVSSSARDTMSYGKEFGKLLRERETIFLSGELGSGKTLFTKGIAYTLGVDELVTSPSFSIMNEYQGRLNLYHFDFYRIEDSEEIFGLLEDYLEKRGSVVVIEWGEKVMESLNVCTIVRFRIEGSRRIIRAERSGH